MNFVFLSSIFLSAGAVDTTPGGVSNMRGFARGADAVTFDPAATAFVNGFELQYEQFSIERERSLFGAYTVIPAGPFRMHLGYEWLPLTNRSFERASVGGAWKLSELLAIGFTYRGLRAREDYFKGGSTWDVGMYAVPTKWLSFSLGLDDIGNPYLLDARQNFSYAAGFAVRPIAGAPWLTLGAQSRLDCKEHEFTETRAVVDVGSRGIHAYGAYDFQTRFLAVGLQLMFGVLEVRQALEIATGDKSRPGTNREELASATVVTFRSNPSESLGDWVNGATVELALNGD
ncbi:MAG: hypothetical protein H7Z43_07605, partial [Clostridia bacterium]|nr:hypothetical protein [Deltaproteobacteria bacterium]